MERYLAPVLCCLQIITAPAAEPWWQVFGEIKPSEFHGGITDGEKPPDEPLRELLATTRFDEWETHEDDLVKLSYPKHPLLKLEVKGGQSGISVEGGVCTTVDNSFERAYVLKAGPVTYGVFLVAKADWLDDGICLCGPMVHHVYRMDSGCLVRFSLLPGGAVKKAQKLGGKLRLMAFEWTHLACPREVYEQLVERMTLKVKHPWEATRFEDEIAKRYGMAGRSGWLQPGTALAEADRIMGSNAVVQDGINCWRGIQNDYPCALTAEFKDGRMVKLTDEGLQPTGEAAVKGSYHWILGELVQTDPSAAAAHAKELFATEEPAWTLAVLMVIDSFDQPPLPPQQLVIESLARARKARSTGIATSALELARDAADLLTDPAEVEKAILALPKGEPEGDWEKSKADALDAIKRRPANSEPEESSAPRS